MLAICFDQTVLTIFEFRMTKNSTKIFTLGHSPDPDDAFMFYGIAQNKIDLRGYRFEHRLEDIQTSNERARREELLEQHGNIVVNGAFSPDGHHAVTASKDKTAMVFDADPKTRTLDEMVALAERLT